MEDIRKEDPRFDEVVELLTPKFRRECEIAFAKPHKRFINRIWAISGIAAMFVIALTIAFKSVVPVSAAEVVSSALADLSDAESVKVEFTWRGIKTSHEEIYRPDLSGDVINGTLYLLRRNGKVLARIDWHDAEKNTIVFNNSQYIHLKDGIKVNKHASSFGDELMNLLNRNSLPDDLKNESEFSTEDNVITIKHNKDIITFCGEFNKNSKQLIKASAIATMPDGKEVSIFETQSIETNVDLPENLFAE